MRTRWLFAIVVWLAACGLDTRGWAQSAESNVIAVDTRTLTMTQLTVTGPPSFAWGLGGTFTATLQYQGAASQDVTAECKWSVSGGPPITEPWDRAEMASNVLVGGVASPVPLLVTASVTRPTGQIVSAPFPVTITESNKMDIGIAFLSPSTSGPVYVRQAGGSFTWRMAARVSGFAADKPGMTFQWTLDGQPLTPGREFDLEIAGPRGARHLKVVATDGPTRTGKVSHTLIFDTPPGVSEPLTLIPPLDPGDGVFVMEDEVNGGTVPFGFNPSRTSNGLIVLTHGIYVDESEAWLWQMARAIRIRLTNEGKPLPNIAILGWGTRSDPSKN